MNEQPISGASSQENNSLSCEVGFVLPPQLTIETAATIAAIFKEIPMTEGMQLSLDASAIEYMTAPGAQLLLSLNKSLEANRGRLSINNGSSVFVAACRDMSLQDILCQK